MKSYLIKLNKILTKKEVTNSVILLIFFISVSVLESLTLLFISKLVLLIQSPNYIFFNFISLFICIKNFFISNISKKTI